MNKNAVRHIIDRIGADALCLRFGVSSHAIRFARTKGEFSGSWYAPLKAMCDPEGIECPLDAFVWKTPTAEALTIQEVS